ncbi:type IV toxin-antitoxin system AbiEi family antitoxin domain-containing protein [Paenarthrobacter nitroguajacolicus]|uniref:type IV toxin-antitoxin system AbiEi family antitoxin domain-containing protein n=1 Tax=Paenarthrobacter nitroguajacolicus TaxID=211146 RepID=UPI00248AB500|nr:type IV toxin-antitoxin system AbiEi family antitoxin domain-containing protein [Paenarthrobacter nitroguajacolicus]MDI2034653.1 hypothetical protein [Paenarthrobacter nitroguajacolicus]
MTKIFEPQLPEGTKLWRTDQLHQAGLNDRKIAAFVRSGELVRPRRGCYIRSSTWAAQKRSVRSLQLIAAHTLGTLTTSARGFVYSHTSAARLHGLYLLEVDDRVHITTPTTASRSCHGMDVVPHTRTLEPGDIRTVRGMLCTSLERTVVDSCLILNDRQSLVLMDHALRFGADRAQMQLMCDHLKGRNGVVALRRALANADARSESPGETLTRELLQRLRIDMPDLQVRVSTVEGDHRLDLAWRNKKLALEFDGKVKYFDYAPTSEVLYKERQRENALIELGWTFIRIKWRDLHREQEFKMRVLRALEQ